MIEKSCAFTGHRPKKFPWGYHEADVRCAALRQTLSEQIAKLVEAGYTDFLTGMAEGTDTWAALAVLALKKEYPALKLHWSYPARDRRMGGRLRRGNSTFLFWIGQTMLPMLAGSTARAACLDAIVTWLITPPAYWLSTMVSSMAGQR